MPTEEKRAHEAESGHAGPGVTVLTHGGFGSRMTPMVMRGKFADFVETRYEGTGFACALSIPQKPMAGSRMSIDENAELAGLSVFVVEDEALVALNLEDMLIDLGCNIVGPAMRVARAQEMIANGFEVDVAILDVNVAGELIFPIAQQLADKGIPIIFATGYGQAGLPEAWHGNTILQKPYTMDDVSGSLAKAVRAS